MNKDIELLREAATYLDFSTKTKGVSDCADLVAFLRSLADRMEKAEPVAYATADLIHFCTASAMTWYLLEDSRLAREFHVPLFLHPASDEVERLNIEVREQARLLGMSAERECNLLGEVERLKAENKRLAREMFVLSVDHEAQLSAIRKAMSDMYVEVEIDEDNIPTNAIISYSEWLAFKDTINQQGGTK